MQSTTRANVYLQPIYILGKEHLPASVLITRCVLKLNMLHERRPLQFQKQSPLATGWPDGPITYQAQWAKCIVATCPVTLPPGMSSTLTLRISVPAPLPLSIPLTPNPSQLTCTVSLNWGAATLDSHSAVKRQSPGSSPSSPSPAGGSVPKFKSDYAHLRSDRGQVTGEGMCDLICL